MPESINYSQKDKFNPLLKIVYLRSKIFKMKHFSLLLLSILTFSNLFSQPINQPDFVKDLTIPVVSSGSLLKNPWGGGLNIPEFFPIDLNNDGIKDLLIYDKAVSKALTFINNGTANTIDYVYQPKYEKSFNIIYNWVILKDYDGDGKIDLFTTDALNVGIAVYKNVSTSSGDLRFELAIDLINYVAFGNNNNIFANQYEYPSILDLDDDGDLDILSFSSSGDQVIYYKNNSMETYNSRDSLNKFVVGSYCWGRFKENSNTCLADLSACPSLVGNPDSAELINYVASQQARTLHSGSTVLAFNANGDSAVDMLIGDIGCNSMYLLLNGGESDQALMTNVIYNWPPAHPINIPVFPAAFSLDVNNDNVNDLVIAPNVPNSSENYRGVWLYLNTGSESAPEFTFTTDQFLSDQMLDFGEGSNPALFDYDNNKVKDIIVGNYGYSAGGGNYTGGIAVLHNIGTNTNPSYELVNRNYADVNSFNVTGIAPSTADLDADGDIDMILGESQGTFIYLQNQAGPLNIPNLTLSAANFQGIDVSTFSVPNLFDFDLDGKLDLLAGFNGSNGGKSYVKFYKNVGSNSSPQFVLQKDTLGNILINQQYIPKGYTSVAIADMNGDFTRELLMADNSGLIRVYAINENNLSGTFQYLYTINPEMGRRINMAVDDINNDGQQDLIIGSYAGGLCILRQDNTSGIASQSLELPVLVYPNPANDLISIQLKSENVNLSTQVKITDLLGREIFNSLYSNADVLQIPISEISNGVYLVTIKNGNKQSTKKIVIRR